MRPHKESVMEKPEPTSKYEDEPVGWVQYTKTSYSVYYTAYSFKIHLYLNFSDPIRLGPGQIMPRGYGISSGNVFHLNSFEWCCVIN